MSAKRKPTRTVYIYNDTYGPIASFYAPTERCIESRDLIAKIKWRYDTIYIMSGEELKMAVCENAILAYESGKKSFTY